MKEKVNILNGRLDAVIWMITLPIIITNMVEGMYGIIDSLFVANVGSLAVASVAFVGPIQDTLNAVATGLSVAGCSLIARYIGANDEQKARRMIGHVFVIGVTIGFIISAVTFVFSNEVLLLAGITDTLLADSSRYLMLTAWGVVFNFITVLYLAIERAQGNTKKAISINMFSLIMKIIFCYLFTIVVNWEITGIGLATILAQGICATTCLISFFSKKNERKLEISEYKINSISTKILLVTALPLIFEKSLISMGFIIINKYVLAFGEPVLAAYGITNKVNSVFFKAVTAFGTGLSVIVAQNMGANQPERVKKAVWKSLGFGLTLAIIFIAFLLPFRSSIAALFVDTSDPTYQHIINAMGIYSASIIPWGMTECAMGIFQGTGDTKFNLFVSLMRIYVFRVPVVIIFSQPIWGIGEYGIWYAMLVSNILSGLFSIGLYLFMKKTIIDGRIEKNKSIEIKEEQVVFE
ncbi:MATE family efflux transporter [Tannockella kyphosi]|uniref:MATE family efflux transporter n=1 Tax=Tannockella kyphosi TaxID=2899121 RepID=UPI002010E3AA|nr:MATE family efflux transporter [Tannockella kyphosi]